MEEVPVFSLSHPCLQLGFGKDNVWSTARWAHQKSISTGVWGASWESAHLQDQQTSWKRCHILQRWKRRSICVCIALFLLDWFSLLWTCNLALMRERLFPNWKSCFDQKLYYILVYAVLGRIQPKNQNHSRWPHRKNLTWKIIYKVLERQLKQPGERWVNPEIRRCRKLLLLLGQEGQGEQVGSRLGLRHGSWDSGGAPWLGSDHRWKSVSGRSHREVESLPEMSPEAERGRSILLSPFLSPPIFPQGLLFALPNQNAVGQEVWKPQFGKLSFP